MERRLLAVASLFAMLAITNSKSVDTEIRVQNYIDHLQNQLNQTRLGYDDRRKVESYLRKYYFNQVNKKNKKIQPLTGDAKKVADAITSSYLEILRTPGNHQKAAEHYLYDAAGQVMYAPGKLSKMDSGVRASRAAERGAITPARKSGGILDDIRSVFGGGESKPAERKPEVVKPKVMRKTTKPVEPKVIKPRETRTEAQLKREKAKKADEAKKKRAATMTKKELAEKKKAKLKRKMDRMRRERAAAQK